MERTEAKTIREYEIRFTTYDYGHQYRVIQTADIEAEKQEIRDEFAQREDCAFNFYTQETPLTPGLRNPYREGVA